MSTILFDKIVFGPIHSRRLGVSLGMNLLPTDGKLCSFNCIYCECGLNENHRTHSKLPTRTEVREALEQKLSSMKAEGIAPDVITFAGNGEPTIRSLPGIDFSLMLKSPCFLILRCSRKRRSFKP
jgi:wyosine [tRNA(Phe)-imidazoG37] synthetase (radical SAM superfamily)